MNIDLNADLGESFGDWRKGRDRDILKIVTSANIACGFHAGDPVQMLRTCQDCLADGVGMGAHPGFRDLEGFGRREIHGMSDEALKSLVTYQIGALQAMARMAGGTVRHVKLHGALANMASRDERLAETLLTAIHDLDPELPVIAIAATCLQAAAERLGILHAREIFADRAYEADGTLVSRQMPGSIIADPDTCAENMLRAVETGKLIAIDGTEISVDPDTICVHGDTPQAVSIASKLRDRLESQGVSIRRFRTKAEA